MRIVERPGALLAAAALAAGLLTGCATTSAVGDAPAPGGTTAAPVSPATDLGDGAVLCAEFPATGPLPGDAEGWWSSTPASADGGILTDPDEWPDARLREHPRVALVDAGSGEVISTWDRITCGDDPDFVPTRTDDWPTAEVPTTVVLDMDTGAVLASFPRTP